MVHPRGATKLVAILTAGFLGALAFAQPAQAAWPGGNGKIIFWKAVVDLTTGAPSSVQIYSMDERGHAQTNLSAAGGGGSQFDIQPSVSPNGHRIVFTRVDPNLAGQIWTMKIDGSDQTNISNDAATASESNPSWSEDGKDVLFVRRAVGTPVLGAPGSIWIRKANGQGQAHQLTSGPDANPAMSPDGDLIAFTRFAQDGPPSIFVMKADGSEPPHVLVKGAKPDWSPDSRRIVYGQGGTGPIMVVRVSDPTHPALLAGSGNEAPAWSPDGKQIVFLHCSGPLACQVAVMTANGQHPHDITSERNDQGVTDQKPDWQPVHGEGGGQAD